MDSYKDFVDNNVVEPKGMLIIETGDFDYPEWNLVIDLTGIWTGLTSGDYKSFNESLTGILTSKVDDISDKCGTVAVTDIMSVLNSKLNTANTVEEYESAYNKLYDVADKHGIKLNQPNESRDDIQGA